MLLSILLSITPIKSTPLVSTTGRPLQSWLLGQVARHDPELAKSYHAGSKDRPYTASSIIDDRGFPLEVGRMVHQGKPYWLRITSYDETISDIIYNKILKELPSTIRLYQHVLRIDGWTTNHYQHPLAAITDYQELCEESTRRKKPIRLQFFSPTAFRSNGNDLVLPIPRRIFTSYSRKWNAYAPEALQIHSVWPNFVDQCVIVNELIDLNSHSWKVISDQKRKYKGFTGTAGFRLLPKPKCGDMKPYWDGSEEVLRSLAIFSAFCGTGHHTTIGMGQTKQI